MPAHVKIMPRMGMMITTILKKNFHWREIRIFFTTRLLGWGTGQNDRGTHQVFKQIPDIDEDFLAVGSRENHLKLQYATWWDLNNGIYADRQSFRITGRPDNLIRL
jgi:hypothetical protein